MPMFGFEDNTAAAMFCFGIAIILIGICIGIIGLRRR